MSEHPLPYEYNGYKTNLEAYATNSNPLIAVPAQAALYVGEVLEHIAFELQRLNAARKTPGWFPATPHGEDH